MKGTKMQKGITLIALIITIIVLLILAVVAIAAIQDSGILIHADRSAIMHEVGTISEKIRLEAQAIKLDAAQGGDKTQTVEDALKNLYARYDHVEYDTVALKTIKLDENGTESIPEITDFTKEYHVVIPEKLNYDISRGKNVNIANLRTEDIFVVDNEFNVYYLITLAEQTVTLPDDPEIPVDLKKYILGQDLQGRTITEILDMDKLEFLDDEETPSNIETETIGAKIVNLINDNNEFYIIYFESKGIIYKFRFAITTNDFLTDKEWGVSEIYNTQEETRVGKKVKYDGKMWTILYDDSINGLQMISDQSLLYNGSKFKLGYADSLIDWTKLNEAEDEVDEKETDEFKAADLNEDKKLEDDYNLEKAIYSYNKAIETLNTACKNIVKINNPNIKAIRSVGSNPKIKDSENKTLYPSENLEKWPTGDNATHEEGIANKRGKSSDENYMLDLDKMCALGINYADKYWLASRCVNENETRVEFAIRETGDGGLYRNTTIWLASASGVNGVDRESALRPVIILEPADSLIEKTEDGETYYILAGEAEE